MSLWTWSLVAVGAFLLLYAAFVLVLVVAGRRESARALAGFIPDCVVLAAACSATRACRAGRRPS